MKNILNALFFIILLTCFANVSMASFGVQLNGKDQGQATGINFTGPSGTTITNPYGFISIPVLSSTLVETGIAGSAYASMATTDLTVLLSYALVKKAISSDPAFSAGILPPGQNGQVFTLEITNVSGAGTYTVTPTGTAPVSAGWTSVKFSQVGQYATFLYVGPTVGWIVQSSGSLNNSGTTLPQVIDASGT